MKQITKRLILTNILIIIIICIVYLLTFNSKIETAITSAYSEAKYKGIKNTENSIGLLVVVTDKNDIYVLKQMAEKNNVGLSCMVSPDLIVENSSEIIKLASDGLEIGIYGTGPDNMYEAIRILKTVYNKNILYVQMNRDIDKDIFSNELTVVVYSINANIAFEKIGNEIDNYISNGAFILYDANDLSIFEKAVSAIKKSGYKIRPVGEML